MKTNRERKKLIIIMLMFSIASLSIGFAAFSTTLNISSSASVNPNSDNFSVKFSSSADSLAVNPIKPEVSGVERPNASNATIINSLTPSISNISVTFANWGYASYTAYIRNEGEYTAYLNSIIFNGDKVCAAVGDTSESLVQEACEDISISVKIGEDATRYTETTELSNVSLEKGASTSINIWIAYSYGGTLPDGEVNLSFPEIALVYSTIDQPGYTPSIMGSDDTSGTLNSKIKADTLFKGTDASVDFGAEPTTGVYVRNGTENHVNPIYYYRGEVDNNNVLFAGKCWKIVRTTETGGTKLIYNGKPTSDNKCNGDKSTIGNSTFNDNSSTEADVSYIYSDGTNSTIKQAVDTWYTSNMTSYTDMLEDTVWCNDRSVTFSGYSEEWGYDVTLFGAYARNAQNNQPSLHCPAEYSLTVSSTQVSNKLTYPAGLLTADELTLAGLGWNGYTESGYLNNYARWWTMSPSCFGNGFASVLRGYDTGVLRNGFVSGEYGVRPAVSLKPGAMVTTGEGTSDKPYIIE